MALQSHVGNIVTITCLPVRRLCRRWTSEREEYRETGDTGGGCARAHAQSTTSLTQVESTYLKKNCTPAHQSWTQRSSLRYSIYPEIQHRSAHVRKCTATYPNTPYLTCGGFIFSGSLAAHQFLQQSVRLRKWILRLQMWRWRSRI